MKTVFATFNFKSDDLALAEKLYLENHVRLTLQLPGLRHYLTGIIRPRAGQGLPHRAAFNYFDDDASLRWALHKSPEAKPLLQDGATLLRVNRWLELDSEIIVPFERRPGLECFILATEFQLKPSGTDGSDLEAADSRYTSHCVELVRNLPNLRHYMISRYQVTNKIENSQAELRLRNPLRMALLAFDSFEGFGDAYDSTIGRQVTSEEEALIANLRVYHIDATVQR